MISGEKLDEGPPEDTPILEKNSVACRPGIARRKDQRRGRWGGRRRSAGRDFCDRSFGECRNGKDLERGEERGTERRGELAHGGRMSNLRAVPTPRETAFFRDPNAM
jgi:hypothetical protein